MKPIFRSLAAFAALFAAASVMAAPVYVTVGPRHQVVRAGGVPSFAVKVTATEPATVLRVDTRRDLLDNYARLHVMLRGKPVEIPVAISDPGPIGASDYWNLETGQAFTFHHNGSPFELESLKPGKYSATLSLTVHGQDRLVYSNVVTFEVVGK